jgi:Mor family transcriptional regulator
MAANVRKLIRDKLIYDDYVNLWATGMREELIWPVLDAKYHLAESTIYRIVLRITNQKEIEIITGQSDLTDGTNQI